MNRALEAVILKTLAGYMNGNGGTLLIGVSMSVASSAWRMITRRSRSSTATVLNKD